MNRITKGLVGLALLVTVAGCSYKQGSQAKEYNNIEVNNDITASKDKKESLDKVIGSITTTNTVQILDVRDKNLFCHPCDPDTGKCDGDVGIIHDYEIIAIQQPDGEKVLIYPYTKFIFKRTAKISYKTLPTGRITSEQFCKLYIANELFAGPDNYEIEADGIITKDGIQYSK
jgi:hypothetical protein